MADELKLVADERDNADIEQMYQLPGYSKESLDYLKLIHSDSDDSEFLKAFRELRTRLYTRSEGKNFVCLVSSVCPKGGGSYVARNLAAATAMNKTKTALLVDANFYSPSVNDSFFAKAELGLTDFLDNKSVTVDQIVYPTFVPRLRVISVGNNREGGTEKLMFERMAGFIVETKSRYPDRMVIVDGPSAGEYDAEVRILSGLCDFVVLVVPNNRVTEEDIQAAVETVGEDRVAGFVLNQFDPR